MKHDIGIDCRMIHHSGIGTYLRGLVTGLHAQDALLEKYKIACYGNELGKYAQGMNQETFSSSIYSVQEQLEYPSHVKGCRVWHAPHYNVPILKGDTKLVVTIHDVIHWIFREQMLSPLKKFYAGTMLKRAVKCSDHIISVSNKTKEDLVQYFEADPNKISVVYESVSEEFVNSDQAEDISKICSDRGIPEKYFLYVGLLKPHKNVHWLARVFSELKKKHRFPEGLVVVGKKDAKYPSAYREISRIGEQEGVYHLTGISSAELKGLYRNAVALVHPSLYEGFGLTPLEAMASGTPVIACRAGSVPEIVGDAARLVAPENDSEMADALLSLLKHPEKRSELIEKGRKQWQKYSWARAAEETGAIYERVLSS